jgi:hypothetical protein
MEEFIFQILPFVLFFKTTFVAVGINSVGATLICALK